MTTMKTLKTLALSLLASAALVTALPTTEAVASNYPPSYVSCGTVDSITTGPFELLKHTLSLSGRRARLTVAYRGYLRDWYPDHEINLWIRLNGHDVFVPAQAGTHNDAYVMFDSGPRDCVWTTPPNTSGVWVCNNPTPTEANLFFWAFNEWGGQNAWDIEVAAESHGQWDSNWGSNFHGRFEPRNSCS